LIFVCTRNLKIISVRENKKTGARVITLLTVEFFRLFLDLPFFGTLFGFSELELFSSLLLAVEGLFENWTPFCRFLWRLLTYFIFHTCSANFSLAGLNAFPETEMMNSSDELQGDNAASIRRIIRYRCFD